MMSRLRSLARPLPPPPLIDLVWRRRLSRTDTPDPELYRPLLEPWRGPAFQSLYSRVRAHTLLDAERCWLLGSSLRRALAALGLTICRPATGVADFQFTDSRTGFAEVVIDCATRVLPMDLTA